MKKSAFKITLLLSILISPFIMSETADAVEKASAPIEVQANIQNGSISIDTIDKLEYGTMKIGEDKSIAQQLVVDNNVQMNRGVELVGKLKDGLPTGVILTSENDKQVNRVMSTSDQILYGTGDRTIMNRSTTGEATGTQVKFFYYFDWKLNLTPGTMMTNTEIADTIQFTATPII